MMHNTTGSTVYSHAMMQPSGVLPPAAQASTFASAQLRPTPPSSSQQQQPQAQPPPQTSAPPTTAPLVCNHACPFHCAAFHAAATAYAPFSYPPQSYYAPYYAPMPPHPPPPPPQALQPPPPQVLPASTPTQPAPLPATARTGVISTPPASSASSVTPPTIRTALAPQAPLPGMKTTAPASHGNGGGSGSGSSNGATKRKVPTRPKRRCHGVVTIGDILDRLQLFHAAKSRGLSKNRACAEIEISKGTVGTYQLRVAEAQRYGLELDEFRAYKWRDFRQVFRTTVINDQQERLKREPLLTRDELQAIQRAVAVQNAADQVDMKPPQPGDALLEETIRAALLLPDRTVGPEIMAGLKRALQPLRIAVTNSNTPLRQPYSTVGGYAHAPPLHTAPHASTSSASTVSTRRRLPRRKRRKVLSSEEEEEEEEEEAEDSFAEEEEDDIAEEEGDEEEVAEQQDEQQKPAEDEVVEQVETLPSSTPSGHGPPALEEIPAAPKPSLIDSPGTTTSSVLLLMRTRRHSRPTVVAEEDIVDREHRPIRGVRRTPSMPTSLHLNGGATSVETTPRKRGAAGGEGSVGDTPPSAGAAQLASLSLTTPTQSTPLPLPIPTCPPNHFALNSTMTSPSTAITTPTVPTTSTTSATTPPIYHHPTLHAQFPHHQTHYQPSTSYSFQPPPPPLYASAPLPPSATPYSYAPGPSPPAHPHALATHPSPLPFYLYPPVSMPLPPSTMPLRSHFLPSMSPMPGAATAPASSSAAPASFTPFSVPFASSEAARRFYATLPSTTSSAPTAGPQTTEPRQIAATPADLTR